MPGRAPKPTNLKLVTGNPGKRAINRREPDPTYLANLEPPTWLQPDAQLVWSEVAPRLARAKLLTECDVDALAMGCVSIAQYRRAARMAGEQLIKSKVEYDELGKPRAPKPDAGGEYMNPWLIVQSMSFKQAMAVFQQFGMSPAARTRIAINPQGDLFTDDHPAKATDSYFT